MTITHKNLLGTTKVANFLAWFVCYLQKDTQGRTEKTLIFGPKMCVNFLAVCTVVWQKMRTRTMPRFQGLYTDILKF